MYSYAMGGNEILSTARLSARFLDLADLDGLAAILADAAVMRFIETGATYTRAQTADLIRRHRRYAQTNNHGLWALVRPADGMLLGWCGILPTRVDNRLEMEFGYLLAAFAWGHGYATEIGRALVAFAEADLAINGLIAMTHPDNAPSVHVIEKCGLAFEKRVTLPKGPRLIYRRPGVETLIPPNLT